MRQPKTIRDLHPYYRLTVRQRSELARERIRRSVDRIWREYHRRLEELERRK